MQRRCSRNDLRQHLIPKHATVITVTGPEPSQVNRFAQRDMMPQREDVTHNDLTPPRA